MPTVIVECPALYAPVTELGETADVPVVLMTDTIRSPVRFIIAAEKKELRIAGCVPGFPARDWERWVTSAI
ncbi:hypothetical protein SDC9_69655 [bioreactor metagenome]|uniref:Uncharacterized protein n=1 Tax=bioreactor metagenome TaxID=1076179 RepID=A0A644Y5G3_9ZZZZ